VQDLLREQAQSARRFVEDPRVGFVSADFAGDDYFAKEGEQAQLIENRTQTTIEIGNHAEGETLGEVDENRDCVGVTLPDAWEGKLGVEFVEVRGSIE